MLDNVLFLCGCDYDASKKKPIDSAFGGLYEK